MSVTTIKTKSREQWLEARRKYVTATEVAQLARRGQDYWDELREIKAGQRTAPDTDTAARAAHHLCDIHFVLWRIEDFG